MIEPSKPVRFIGGKYNGFQGTPCWVGDTCSSVYISYHEKQIEVIEDNANLKPLDEYLAGQNETERALKGNPSP